MADELYRRITGVLAPLTATYAVWCVRYQAPEVAIFWVLLALFWQRCSQED